LYFAPGVLDFFDVEFDPCLQFVGGGDSDLTEPGVRVSSNRFGIVASKAPLSLEMWAQ
jgi:hypothetical protein